MLNGRSPIEKLDYIYSNIIRVLAASSIGAIVVIMGVQVFYRYILNNSLIWTEEVCRNLFIWATFLFAGPALRRGQMISIQALMRILAKPIVIVSFVVGHGLVIVLTASLVYYGYQYARLNSLQVIPSLNFIWSDITGSTAPINVSMFWVYLSVPVGLAILLGHLIIEFYAQLKKIWRS